MSGTQCWLQPSSPGSRGVQPFDRIHSCRHRAHAAQGPAAFDTARANFQTVSICSSVTVPPIPIAVALLVAAVYPPWHGFQSRFRDLDTFPGSCFYSSRFVKNQSQLPYLRSFVTFPASNPSGFRHKTYTFRLSTGQQIKRWMWTAQERHILRVASTREGRLGRGSGGSTAASG